MKRTSAAAWAAILAGLSSPALAVAQPNPTLEAHLTGTGTGDPDGTGVFVAEVDRDGGRLCYELTVSGIGAATVAHVHRGAPGESGRAVVGLDAPSGGSARGCESVAPDLLDEIVRDPGAFYVNVHSAEYRSGAIRGQLFTGR